MQSAKWGNFFYNPNLSWDTPSICLMYMMYLYKQDNLLSVKSKSEIISHLHQQLTSQLLLSPGNYLSDTLFMGLNTDVCTQTTNLL